ncbi:cytidylyltransferase domain-containing protein [Ornithinibacillus scapharcae]|uniref:acylneuraminate cytidylyltransferase family protein n=1 Tax=Ornithinibacillus scapharcae TaxID=1147159 RepID=UPI000225AB39|nr:acylneuraminate cytidylyltransferase family protein [Ornithinibacillus scapharcae]
MNVLFTICGRAGSKGIKNKNLKKFLDYPLPYYTLSAIDLFTNNNVQINSDIVLNTDSKDLIKLIQDPLKLNLNVIERESSLGLDNTPKKSVILNCLKVMEEQKSIDYDIVVDMDITAPLRTAHDVDQLIKQKTNSDADVVFSVTSSRRNPYFNMVYQTENGYKRVIESSFNARQEAPEIFDMNASLYAYSPAFLKSEKGLFDGKCDVIKMKDTAVLDLDHPDDFEFMEVIADHLFNKYPAFGEIRNNIKNLFR